MTGLIVGLLLGVPAGIAVGKAYARALRAYRDLMATKKAIKGLFQRVVTEWLMVAKVGGAVCLVLALVFTAGLWAAVR